MKILFLNRSDSTGGAAVACMRLLNSLRTEGIDASILVLDKTTSNASVFSLGGKSYCYYKGLFNLAIEKAIFKFWEVNSSIRFAFSMSNTGEDVIHFIKNQKPDIIHIHWINQGFVSVRQLSKIMSLGIPVVWTLHDCWAFTGGCHYPSSCERYTENCGNCPFLRNPYSSDISFHQLKYKIKIYTSAKMQIVTCSNWLKNIASRSKALQNQEIIAIPNPIDVSVFSPINKYEARIALSLDPKKQYLLFGAGNIYDKRKGLIYLFESLQLLKQQQSINMDNIVLLAFGKGYIPDNFGFKVVNFSTVTSIEKLVEIYSAADAFILPSLEDNLPNTVMESLACGTPVVAFASGGVPEMIINEKTGFLANLADTIDLSKCISKILLHPDKNAMNIASRQFVLDTYSPSMIAKQYIDVYKSVLE